MPGYGLTSKGINYDIMRDKGPHGHASQPQLSTHNKGGRVGLNKGGRTGRQIGGQANLLEEEGRLDAERMNPNRRAEKRRVIGELNRGYNKGGRVGLQRGGRGSRIAGKGDGGAGASFSPSHVASVRRRGALVAGDGGTGEPMPWIRRQKGGRVGLKKGSNGKWIQKVNKSIKARGTKGKCTPITKPGCTGRAKALAKTFKKMAKKRKAA